MVAERPALNQAVAQLSDNAWRFLRDVHAGRRRDARETASRHLRDLRQIARCAGVELDDVPAYRSNAAHWRAIERLAGEAVATEQATQAG